MKELYFREFTNRHGDAVKLQASADSFGGFHLVTHIKMIRRTEEIRVVNGSMVKIPKSTITDETSHAQFPTELSVLNELNLERVMNADPLFSSADYSEWQKSLTNKEEGK